MPCRSITSLASATLREVLPTVASTDLLLQSMLQGSTATVVAPVVDMKSAWDAGRPEMDGVKWCKQSKPSKDSRSVALG